MRPKLPRGISGDRLLRALKRLGFEVVHTKGSHMFVRHPIPIGTFTAILRQAGVSIDDIREHL